MLLGLRQLTRASSIARPCSATPEPRPTGRSKPSTSMLAEIERLGRDGVALDELETMRAGLKSSLIMAQESSMSRSGSLASDWFFLGRVRPIEEIAAELDALTPGVGLRLRRQAAEPRRADDPDARADRPAASPLNHDPMQAPAVRMPRESASLFPLASRTG